MFNATGEVCYADRECYKSAVSFVNKGNRRVCVFCLISLLLIASFNSVFICSIINVRTL